MIQITFLSNDNKCVSAPPNSNLLRVPCAKKAESLSSAAAAFAGRASARSNGVLKIPTP